MSDPRYHLANDSFDENEINAAIEVLRSRRYTMGTQVDQFEKALASWIGVKHAIMVNSGSSANLILIDSLIRRSNTQLAPLSPGDEILVPAMAWPTTVWPIVQLGLVPVFVDVDEDSMAISLEDAEKNISKKTKAMFLIHVLGQACNMKKYTDFCDQHGLVLAEDCCESLGAFWDGTHVGTSGYAGTLSHYFSHHLTTIEGGTIITNNDALADDLRSMRAHGWSRDRTDARDWERANPTLDPRFLFVMPGYNARPTDIQGAIGLVQLGKLDNFLVERDKIAYRVKEMTDSISWLKIQGEHAFNGPPQKIHRRDRCHSWMAIAFLIDESCPVSKDRVIEVLETHGVETRTIIAGNLTKHPGIAHAKCRISDCLDTSNKILERGFMIGCHPSTADAQLDQFGFALESLAKL